MLMNATGEAQLGDDIEATLIVKNYNFALYFNGYCPFVIFTPS